MAEVNLVAIIIGVLILVIFLAGGIKIIRPTHRAAIETLGKYTRFQNSGITWIFPKIQKLYAVNITEQLVDVLKQDVITSDNLNCSVDAQIYFKVQDSEQDLKNALYNVNSYSKQIVQLARTTLRNVIGTKPFKEVNSNRNALNEDIFSIIISETKHWGIEIVRCELKEIEPPEDVQATMNEVIKAENTKQAAQDFANAREIEADGYRRAAIKEAEGVKQAQILRAEGQAKAIVEVANARAKEIELVNDAAQEHFKDQAVALKTLEVNEQALKDNTKYIIADKGQNPTLVLNAGDGKVIPLRAKVPKGLSSSGEPLG